MLCAAHVEMENRMFNPFLLVFGNGETLKQLFPPLEIGLEGGGEE